MGRRSRRRVPLAERSRATTKVAPAGAGPALRGAKRALASYLAGAILIAAGTLVGIASLGGTLGPLVVFLASLALAGGLWRWTTARLAGATLDDDDRLLRTGTTALLGLCVVLAGVVTVVVALS